jgi:hypothetical protein
MELMVFVAVFSVVIGAFISILVLMLNLQTSQSAATEVGQQGQFLLQQIQYYVGSAKMINMPLDSATSTLNLRTFSPSLDPTIMVTSGSIVYLLQGSTASPQPLTTSKVLVTGLSFTRHFNLNSSSSAFGIDSVSFSFTMSATSTNNKTYSQQFQSSVAVSAPVGKIALIQQAAGASNNANVATVVATFATPNSTSSLLVAVVANTTTSASVAIADSAGNTWVTVASTSYLAYNTNLKIFAAMNAKNATNTVTATFGAGAGYASLFIYEYRGAATSSSFDTSSTQLQPNTQNPSSGLANPTSSVELIFGATYNGNTAEIPMSGSGFTLESSSTIAHVFTEDAIQYITGPVSADWQYFGTTPSSSVVVATFR